MPIEMSRYMSRELLEPPEPEDHADAALPAPSPAAAPVATPATAAPAPTNEPPASLLMRLPAAPLAPAYVVAGGPRARSILDDLGEPALRRPIAAPAAANDASIVAPTPPAAPPAAAPYVGERPVDAAWLAERETALKGVRADYEAQRAAAQASTGTGPGWIPATLVTDESGQTRSASGAPTVFIADPGAAPQLIGWNESSPVYGAPAGRTLEFNEEAFAASYRAQAGAPLQTLARSYGTDAATLLAQHPGLWTLATQDHALNAGPAPAGRAMGDAGQLAMLDLYMADPQIAALIQRYGGNAAPATSGIAQEQVRIYGQARYEQLTRLGNAMQAVRSEYVAAMQQAQQSGGGSGWVEQTFTTVTVSDESGATRTETTTARGFSHDAFTAWYNQQDGIANRAFASLYGQSHTQYSTDESGAGVVGRITFDNPNWAIERPGSGMSHTSLVRIDPNDAPRLNDDAAVGFDLEAGWATQSGNLHHSHDWFETVVQVAIVAAVSCVSAGTLGAAAAGAVGYGTAGAVASAAVVGATASVVSGAMNGNLTFKGVLQGALSGALTAGLMGSLGGTVSEIAGPAGTIALRTTVQGGINALLGGSFRDGAIAGLASGLAEQAGASINKGIDDAVAKGTMSAGEAIAARKMARVFSSAVRALGNPNDPQYAFASDLVNAVVNDGLAAAGEPGTGVGAQPAASPDAGLALPDPTLSLNSELDDLANGPPDLLARSSSPPRSHAMVPTPRRSWRRWHLKGTELPPYVVTKVP